MIPENDILKIVRYASKAPSGHNTQPWKFRINENKIEILPDFNRSLPEADASHHELYISIGCALENISISAHVLGYDIKYQLIPAKKGMAVQVHLDKASSQSADKLFSYIEIRQVRRNLYLPDPIPAHIMSELTQACAEKGIYIKTYVSKIEKEQLEPFILEAAEQQFRNRSFVNELVEWIRFTEKEAMQKGDGISTASMGLPGMGRVLGSFMFRNLITPQSERKRWKKIIANSASFLLLAVEKNDIEHWIRLGRSFQRLGLTASKNGVSHSHVNMPCEIIEIREKMSEQLKLKGLTPLLLIRAGYSGPMPYSFRRNLNETVIKKSP